MKIRIIIVTLLGLYCSFATAESSILFDIRYFCRLPIEEAKENLPVDIKFFKIETRENPRYGHEETWTLSDNTILKPLGLKSIQIEIHQNFVQMVWFIDIGVEKEKQTIISKNLSRAGLQSPELNKVMSEYRVKAYKGFPIRILGESRDYYECFEYHAGH